MVFNATFNNISDISYVAVSFIVGENHRPAASHWQTLSHNVVSRKRKPSDKYDSYKVCCATKIPIKLFQSILYVQGAWCFNARGHRLRPVIWVRCVFDTPGTTNRHPLRRISCTPQRRNNFSFLNWWIIRGTYILKVIHIYLLVLFQK